MAAALWTTAAVGDPTGAVVNEQLEEHLAEVGQIVFFLMGAMAIVETVDSHQGFKIVTDAIKTKNTTSLLWI
eukprot:9045542-Pyramimonas_sp.AAC.1